MENTFFKAFWPIRDRLSQSTFPTISMFEKGKKQSLDGVTLKIFIMKKFQPFNICAVCQTVDTCISTDGMNGKKAENIIANAHKNKNIPITTIIVKIRHFRMNEIEFILSDLNRGRYRSDQIEKNVEKWFKKILKHLYDYSCPGDILIKLTRVILIKVKDLNLNRILGPLIGGWVTELLQKSVAAKNHTIYLSIIALFLR